MVGAVVVLPHLSDDVVVDNRSCNAPTSFACGGHVGCMSLTPPVAFPTHMHIHPHTQLYQVSILDKLFVHQCLQGAFYRSVGHNVKRLSANRAITGNILWLQCMVWLSKCRLLHTYGGAVIRTVSAATAILNTFSFTWARFMHSAFTTPQATIVGRAPSSSDTAHKQKHTCSQVAWGARCPSVRPNSTQTDGQGERSTTASPHTAAAHRLLTAVATVCTPPTPCTHVPTRHIVSSVMWCGPPCGVLPDTGARGTLPFYAVLV